MFNECPKSCSDRGATALEYAILLAAVAGVMALVIFGMGIKVQSTFNAVDSILP